MHPDRLSFGSEDDHVDDDEDEAGEDNGDHVDDDENDDDDKNGDHDYSSLKIATCETPLLARQPLYAATVYLI